MVLRFFSLIILFLVIACETDDTDVSERQRPIDPWVFRSVLDNNPRMVTAALDEDLYVAYFTESGALYKAWKGLVNFEGAVYNKAHGPQPTSVGDAYLENKYRNPWILKKSGKRVNTGFTYRGHRLQQENVSFLYTLSDPESGLSVEVSETPYHGYSPSGQLVFHRAFEVKGLPESYELTWRTRVGSVVDPSQVEVEGAELALSEPEVLPFSGREFLEFDAELTFINDGKATFSVVLVKAVYEDPNIGDGFGEDTSGLPVGARLIASHDCKTCHNRDKNTIGPSYLAIAKRYPHSEANVNMLAGKIREGGSGAWGDQVMTAHPEIADIDLKDMVRYIFSLAEYAGEEITDDADQSAVIQPADVNDADLLPGSVTRVYEIPGSTDKFPDDLDRKQAVMAGIMPNFDNLTGADFRDLTENFAILAQGYIHISEPGTYQFRLWSDDGSLFYLHDNLLIDNDGAHGTAMKQASVNMAAGYHPFRLEYFQGVGGKFLSLNYKNEKDESWQVVPEDKIFHNSNNRPLIGNLSLPMSVTTRIPGDRNPVDGMHPAFDIYQARPGNFKPKVGGMDFLSDGRLVVSTWDKTGGVYIVSNPGSGEPGEIEVKKIAGGLAEPLGLAVVDDRIFVLQKQELTELVDLDGDEVIDVYRNHCNAWGVTDNFHEFSFGMIEKDGYLYATLATGVLPGGAGMPDQHPDRGSVIRVSVDTGEMEIVANGLRTPNGIGIGYNNGIFVADNQGDWVPASKIVEVEKGDWYGSRVVDYEGTADKKAKQPVVWLPQDEIGNSPSTPLGINTGPYRNQMIHGEVTHGGIKRVFVEEVDGQLQGCVFRFIQGLEAGVNRLAWGPDSSLYAGGIGNPGNWQHTGKKWYGLQRIQYNGAPVFEMLAVEAKTNGLLIRFTHALREGDGWDPGDYEIKQWYYKPTAEYGGPKLDEQRLEILSVSVADDRKSVFLELEGMKAGHVLYILLKGGFISENDQSLWTTEGWYTMNRIPVDRKGQRTRNRHPVSINALSEAEVKKGWKLLFDGKNIEDNFHMFNGEGVDNKWSVTEEGWLHFDPEREGSGGDIITNETYEDFELKLEWRISNCGNSGVMFNVIEDEKYCCTYLTGPEMQILDNTCHPDTRYRTHRAGDLYDMIETRYMTVKPAGQWNSVEIRSLEGKVDFWLNGYKVVSFEMFGEAWDQMIAGSKFADWEDFGTARQGHIALQDHGDKVWFRNIKIRELNK